MVMIVKVSNVTMKNRQRHMAYLLFVKILEPSYYDRVLVIRYIRWS